MPNILSVIHYPVFGGPGNCNCYVSARLEPRGYHTHVVLPDEPGNAVERFREWGIEPTTMPLHRIRAVKNPAVHARFLRNFDAEVKALQRLIREKNIDVVLLNGSANPHGALAAQREGVAVVWQLVDTYPPPLFLSGIMRLVVRWSDVIMTNGMTTAAMHPGAIAFPGPLINFGPWVPAEKFTHDDTVAAAARVELGLSPDDTVVGTVNNINPQKGHFTFLRAAAKLKSTTDVRFVILGPYHFDDYRQALEAEAVRLNLRVDEDLIIRDAGSRVHELAQALDLYWLTSEPRGEGMSMSLAEAQALGIPVVVTRSGAVHETIRDGHTGFLVAPHDTDEIVRRSTMLLADPQLYQRFSANAAAHIRATFSDTATADRHAEAYDAAIEIRARKNKAIS